MGSRWKHVTTKDFLGFLPKSGMKWNNIWEGKEYIGFDQYQQRPPALSYYLILTPQLLILLLHWAGDLFMNCCFYVGLSTSGVNPGTLSTTKGQSLKLWDQMARHHFTSEHRQVGPPIDYSTDAIIYVTVSRAQVLHNLVVWQGMQFWKFVAQKSHFLP